ncbi:MAG: acyl-CoA dehydrogenase family protein [Thermoleophilia bacterium]|nr:acyl-CoA dehydrogenase family protein [Thermoleophilia bacterium]
MHIELTRTQRLFGDSLARFLSENHSFERRREILQSEHGFWPEHWARYAELGVLGAPFPEEYGGLGEDPVTTMVIMEQFGRSLVTSPFLATVVLGGHLVLFGGSEEQRRSILPAVANGEAKLAFAFAEPAGRYDLFHVATRATPGPGGFAISGEKCTVFDAAVADTIAVLARTSGSDRDRDGLSLFLVERGAGGLSRRDYRTQDGGRASDLRFERVRVGPDALVGELDGAHSLVERVIDHGIAAVCAEAVGAMRAVLEQTLDYLKVRRQFGQPLASFQVLQHRMADVYISCELAQSVTQEATLRVAGADAAARRRSASAAKYLVGSYGREVGHRGVHLHGGVGMTADNPVGHYLKRLALIDLTFGDSAHHLVLYRELSRKPAPPGPGTG